MDREINFLTVRNKKLNWILNKVILNTKKKYYMKFSWLWGANASTRLMLRNLQLLCCMAMLMK